MTFPLARGCFGAPLQTTMTSITDRSMSRATSRVTKLESHRLSSRESGWRLSGSNTGPTLHRTRGGGNGRPNLKRDEASIVMDESSDEDEEGEWDEAYEDSEEESSDNDYEEFEKPKPTRLLLEHDATMKFIEKNSRCRECYSQVIVESQTICLASHLVIKCSSEDCGYVDYSEAPSRAKIGETTDNFARSTDYAVNALYVLSFVANGDGCTEATRLLGLLGLPNDTTMQGRSFGIIEERMSPMIQSVARQILLENLKEEVQATFAAMADKDDNDFQLWLNSFGDNATVNLS
jgi:hypothetical protein